MMKMFKRIMALSLAAAVTVTGLSGCGGKTETSAQGTSGGGASSASGTEGGSAPKEVDTVTVWSDNISQKPIRDEQVAAFNEGIGKELGIKIEFTVYGTDYMDTIKLAAGNGDAPDLFRSDSKWLTDFVKAGYVVALEDMDCEASRKLIEMFDPYCIPQRHTMNGKHYTLPYSLTTYKFLINKDLWAKAGLTEADYPKTWAEVRDRAAKITAACNGDAYGFGLGLGTLWTLSSYFTTPAGKWTGHYGYDYANQQFEYSAYAPMLEELYGMAQDGSVLPGYESMDADSLRAQFSAGVIGMMPAASFDCALYNVQFPAECDWAVIDVPTVTGENEYKDFVQPADLLCVGTNALDHYENVMKVMEYFYSDECAAEFYEEAVLIPVRKEAIELAKKEPAGKGFAEFAEGIDNTFLLAMSPDTIVKVKGLTYREVMANYLTVGGDINEILAELDGRYNEALKEISPDELALYLSSDETIKK